MGGGRGRKEARWSVPAGGGANSPSGTRSKALGLDLENEPTRAADLDVAFRTAAWFWNSRKLNTYADAREFDTITRRINGGYNGKEDRDARYARALEALGAGSGYRWPA